MISKVKRAAVLFAILGERRSLISQGIEIESKKVTQGF